MTGIHATALIDADAHIGRDVEIGPFCVLEHNVTIGDRCKLAARVVVKSGSTLGEDNDIGEGAIVGGRPQHLGAGESVGDLQIGRGNTIRENTTIHRGLATGRTTVIGDDNMIMIGSHIAHDCQVGNHVIVANNVMLAGHVVVGDRAYLSGAVGIHQFCRVGAFAMVGGQAHITRDVPPYITVDGLSSLVVGLNTIGLRRNGFTPEDFQQLKAAYRTIFRSGLTWGETLMTLEKEFRSGPAAAFYEFLATGNRGFVQERRSPLNATIRMPSAALKGAGAPNLRKVG